MSTEIKKIKLTNIEISQFIEELGTHMNKLKTERRNALKLSLSTEEILLRWQEHFGSDTVITVTLKKRFGTLNVVFSLCAEEWNPLDADFDDREYSAQLLNKLGLAPVYSYNRGTNYVTLKLSEQRDNSVFVLLSAVFAAILVGVLGLKFAPVLATDILTQFLIPLRTTVLNTLTAVAVPVVFFSVLQGIVGVGDIASFGKIGKLMMARFVIKIAAFTAAAGLVLMPLFSIDLLGSTEVTSFSGALQMILNIFPKTLLMPFVDGNALQAIVVAIALGLALLVLDNRANGIKNTCEQINAALYIIMEWVGKLIPALVFILVLETVWTGNINSLLGLWKPTLATALICVFMILFEVLNVSVRYKVSPILLIKKLLPSNLIAFGTSCAMATYSVTTETCEKGLGINKKVMNLGLPIGFVTYMPAVSVYYLIILFYGLEQYGLSCSFEWLLIAWITVTLLSIATPPVSGGSMACFAVLLSQMGLPAETIAYALAMNIIAERFCATADLSMLQLELVITAKKTGYLDREALNADES